MEIMLGRGAQAAQPGAPNQPELEESPRAAGGAKAPTSESLELREGLSAARRMRSAGRWVEALALYREVSERALSARASKNQQLERRVAIVEGKELLARMPAVVITVQGVEPSEVRVLVDGVTLETDELGRARKVNPGVVHVRGVFGSSELETFLELSESEVKPLRLVFEPSSGPSRRPGQKGVRESAAADSRAARAHGDFAESSGGPQRLLGYLSLGVGGAALITGGVFGFLALRDEAKLEDRCPDLRCPDDLNQAIDSYESKKLIATAGLTAGVVLVVSGALLSRTTSSPGRQQGGLAVYCDGRQLGFRGRF